MVHSFAQWFEEAESSGLDLAEVIERREIKETGVPREAVRQRITSALDVMRNAVEEGLQEGRTSPSGLTGGRSGRLAAEGPRLLGDDFTAMLSRAIATLETNARMGVIMATPTAGARLLGQARWNKGVWRVVVGRSLRSPRGAVAVRFGRGRPTKVAFAVWEGSSGERGGIKAFSNRWHELTLEP